MKNIQVLARAIEIIEILSSSGSVPIQPSEVARRAGIKTPTAARIIDTLCNLGYAHSCGRRQGYVLGDGIKALCAGNNTRALLKLAKVPMLEAAEKLDEYVALVELSGGDRHIVYEVKPNNPIQITSPPTRCNALADLAGRILLAKLAPARRKRLLNPAAIEMFWPELAKNPTLIDAQLDKLATHESWIDRSGDVVSICVPLGASGVLACIAPAYRTNELKIHKTLATLTTCVQIITARIKFA